MSVAGDLLGRTGDRASRARSPRGAAVGVFEPVDKAAGEIDGEEDQEGLHEKGETGEEKRHEWREWA